MFVNNDAQLTSEAIIPYPETEQQATVDGKPAKLYSAAFANSSGGWLESLGQYARFNSGDAVAFPPDGHEAIRRAPSPGLEQALRPVDQNDRAFILDKLLRHTTQRKNEKSIRKNGLIPPGAKKGDDKLTESRKESVYFVKETQAEAAEKDQWASRWIIPPNMYATLQPDETGTSGSVRYQGVVPARFMISDRKESTSAQGAAGATKVWLGQVGRNVSVEYSKKLLRDIRKNDYK